MEKSERLKLYESAIEKWGIVAQLEMAMEESMELALGIRKHLRNDSIPSFENVIEEIADVEIMIEQMELIFRDSNIRELIEKQKEYKLNRLTVRLDGYNGNF